MSISEYFANSYAQARQKFLTSCADKASFIKSWQHPLRGIEGEKLYVDLAWLGNRDALKVLILVSGTHGVEGYCGSGIQVCSLTTDWYQPTEDLAVVMIHGLNPWGMSHWRRVNEEGVDLNRNFIDFQQPLPRNELYDALAETIVPREWTAQTQQETWEQLFAYLYQSESNLESLLAGQYHYWYAPYYGGAVPCWSNRLFTYIIQEYLQNKLAVGLLDYHTGLGQYATGQLIVQQSDDSQTTALLSSLWGEKMAIAGSANSVAPYRSRGTLLKRLQQQLATSLCLAAVYEFGTIAETEVFHALLADHWLYAHGNLNSLQATKIRQAMLDAFYCATPDWQESVCNLALTAQTELLAALRSIDK